MFWIVFELLGGFVLCLVLLERCCYVCYYFLLVGYCLFCGFVIWCLFLVGLLGWCCDWLLALLNSVALFRFYGMVLFCYCCDSLVILCCCIAFVWSVLVACLWNYYVVLFVWYFVFVVFWFWLICFGLVWLVWFVCFDCDGLAVCVGWFDLLCLLGLAVIILVCIVGFRCFDWLFTVVYYNSVACVLLLAWSVWYVYLFKLFRFLVIVTV